MVMTVTAESGAITAAINSFRAAYHSDYFMARCLAKIYLSTPPSPLTAVPLASALSEVLTRWGAGKRGAPSCQSTTDMCAALNSPALHSQLRYLEACIPFLTIASGRRRLAPHSVFNGVAQFDRCLIDTLHILSSGLLVANTNVTYPMKSLLLLTSLMPAFDSQVKGGLSAAGISGVKKTRYLLPVLGSADAQKICALPFYIADCISRQASIINREAAGSSYQALANEHGRIFDILLFMQNRGVHPTVYFAPQEHIRWYAI